MKAFLLKLDDKLHARTQLAAKRRWISMSAYIRTCILTALESGQPTKADGDSSTGDQSEPTGRNESGKEVVI
jgi:hypothetical protein